MGTEVHSFNGVLWSGLVLGDVCVCRAPACPVPGRAPTSCVLDAVTLGGGTVLSLRAPLAQSCVCEAATASLGMGMVQMHLRERLGAGGNQVQHLAVVWKRVQKSFSKVPQPISPGTEVLQSWARCHVRGVGNSKNLCKILHPFPGGGWFITDSPVCQA